jgi:hypothetical protein
MEAAGNAWAEIASFRIENAEEKSSSWFSKAPTRVGGGLFRGFDAREKFVT